MSEVTICWRFASRLLLASLALVASVGGPLLACGNGSTPPDGGACAVDVPQGCPSWTKDVKPIIDARCLGCHGEGGIASSRFDYTTYAGVFRAHASILSQVSSCTMPPADAAQPTPSERGTLVAWVGCDAPSN